jgi:shikimate dehydrogenase
VSSSREARTLAAVIGHPITHSLSPVIHEAAFLASHRDGRYIAVDCDEKSLSSVFSQLQKDSLVGISVTMPLKEAVIDCLDSVHVDASLLNAVNCVSMANGRTVGYNTDGDGCCDALIEQGGVTIDGATAVVLGAGGTARSVALALGRRGARVIVVNRTQENAERLVNQLQHALADGSGSLEVGDIAAIADASIVVNATSVGMNSNESPVPGELLHKGLTVLDAVYSPLETALLRAAAQVGAGTVDGLWMLIHQARHQQLLWFGENPNASVMRAAAEQELERRRK